MAAIPNAFDSVCNTTTLSSSSISEHALSLPEKSTYASSTTMIPSNPPSTISRTTDAGTLLPVGLPGEHRNRSFEKGVAARRTFFKACVRTKTVATERRRRERRSVRSFAVPPSLDYRTYVSLLACEMWTKGGALSLHVFHVPAVHCSFCFTMVLQSRMPLKSNETLHGGKRHHRLCT